MYYALQLASRTLDRHAMTYAPADFCNQEKEEERLDMAWANETSGKLGMVAAAYRVLLGAAKEPAGANGISAKSEDGAAAAPVAAPANSMVAKAISRVVDASEMQLSNIEVVICGAKHPSLAASPHKRSDVDVESEVRVHLHTVGWARASEAEIADEDTRQSHGGVIASPHEFRYEQDLRVDGILFFRTDFSMIIDVDMQEMGVPKVVNISSPSGMTLQLWPRQVALLNKFMGWLSHANSVMNYAAQRCGPKQPVRPCKMKGEYVQHISDGIIAVETRHRDTSANQPGSGSAGDGIVDEEDDKLNPKELSFAELDSAQLDAALRLGCGTEKAWDNGEAVVWLKSWDELTSIEKKAATELGMDEWNWDDSGGENDDDGSAVTSRQSLSCFSFPDTDTRMAILHSMDVELKRINARRLWDYALRCIRYEQAARAPHNLFRRRVMKNRTETKYVSLWRRQQELETAKHETAASELKTVQDQLTEIEEASHSLHALSGRAGFWPAKSALLDYAEIIHCRKLAQAAEDATDRTTFDPAPPTSAAAVAAGPALRASLHEFRVELRSRATAVAAASADSEVAAISFVLGGIAFRQDVIDEVTHVNLEVKEMSMGIATVASDEDFNFVTCKDPKVNFVGAKISMQPLLMKVSSQIGCVACVSDLRPLNFINREMSANAPASPSAVYAPLLPEVADANDAVKFEDDMVELERERWRSGFARFASGNPDGVSLSPDEAADIACRLIIESVGESAQQEYESIRKNSGHTIDWDHVQTFAERVGYLRHDHLQTAMENMLQSIESSEDTDQYLDWDRFCKIMTSMEKAHRAELIAAEHPRMSLDVHVSSPRIVLTANPESDVGTQLVLEPGNIAVATFLEGEMVILSVDRDVKQHGSDQRTAFINAVQSDIANALGIPVTDICHITITDATVPAPEGDTYAELRHLLRVHRDDLSQALQTVDINNDGFLDPSEVLAALQTLAWDVDASQYDRYCQVIVKYLDNDHDGKLSLCEMKDDLASNRTIHGRTDCRIGFSLRPRAGTSAASYAATLQSQAADAGSKLRNGVATKRVETYDVDVSDDTSGGHMDHHFFDTFHFSWTDFQVSLEKPGDAHAMNTRSIRDVLVSKFDVHAYIAACFLPDFLMVGQPHLARTKARVEMSSMNIQASMQNLTDISTLTSDILANMEAADTPQGDTPAPPIPAQPAATVHHDFKELDVEFSCGPWTVRLNHATKRPILDFTTKLKIDKLVKQSGTMRLQLGLNMSAQYDNLHVGHWEPLLEPWDLSIGVSQSARAMEIIMRSQQMMNVNVSHSLLQNVMGSMNVSAEEGRTLQSQSPFNIQNHLGTAVRVRLGHREWAQRSVQFYHKSREIFADGSAQVELDEMRSVDSQERLPARVIRVEFPGGPWKTLALSNLNRAGVTKILLHKQFTDAKDDRVVRRKYPRRQPSHHDKALLVAAAHTAQRSTVVHIDNQSPFMLVREDETDTQHGWSYSAHPPHSIAPNETAIFASESHSLLAGTESEVTYRYVDEDKEDRAKSTVILHWANPIFGEATAATKHDGDQHLDVEIVGPTQLPCNEVTFVVREPVVHDDHETFAHRHDSLDQQTMICAVDVSNSGIKSLVLCTTIQFQNDTEERLIIEFGHISEKGDFTSLGSEVVASGDTEYMRIELCTAKYARLRPATPTDTDDSEFEWCDEYLELDKQDRPHTVSCNGTRGVFHCMVSPSIQDPLDARQRWRVQPVRTLVNMLPCPVKVHLFADEKTDSEMLLGTTNDGDTAAPGMVISPGARIVLPTIWPHTTDVSEGARPKTAWLSVSELGMVQNVLPETARRVCVYADDSRNNSTQKRSKDTQNVAESFPIQLKTSVGTLERRGHATIGYEENQSSSDIVLYCSHWIVNRTGNAFIVRGTGEHETDPITVQPRQAQNSGVEHFGDVFNIFGLGNAAKPKATMLFKCADESDGADPEDAEEQQCEVDMAQKVEAFDMQVGDALTRCSVRVGLAEAEFWRTKVIEINPLWVIVNQTSGPLSIVEHVERTQALMLTKSFRAQGTAADDQYVPFTLDVGESNEVLAAPRGPKAAYALRFALGTNTPIVEESITIKVWEHERRMITKGWGVKFLGQYPMSPLIPVPIAGRFALGATCSLPLPAYSSHLVCCLFQVVIRSTW